MVIYKVSFCKRKLFKYNNFHKLQFLSFNFLYYMRLVSIYILLFVYYYYYIIYVEFIIYRIGNGLMIF